MARKTLKRRKKNISIKDKIDKAKNLVLDKALTELEDNADVLEPRDLKMLTDIVIQIEKTQEEAKTAENFSSLLQNLIDKYNSKSNSPQGLDIPKASLQIDIPHTTTSSNIIDDIEDD